MIFIRKGKNPMRRLIRVKKEQNKDDASEQDQQHSMVCNDQLFFQELRIAAEEAERDHIEEVENE
ncbi:hypothetical protein UB32_14280 [Mesobacillus subterraneus]|uniref:Uncharacterized protein n=1 Tax=Mesobacillus subterraneus TaxID=285983 RepID=A0A0D6Z9R6_9BACI|nr:hypothetical protein UB32_14280 [Mesobacillus subterraneus]